MEERLSNRRLLLRKAAIREVHARHRVRGWSNFVSSNRRISMKTFATLALLAGIGLAGLAPAQALPLAPLSQDEAVILIAGGCGPGMHRGPYGGCRQNFANPAAHACPRGFHIGPGGRCRGNGR
jgi:hypothetical protein